MSDTLFINASGATQGTVVQAAWLNDVNTKTYDLLLSVAGTNTITATGPQSFAAYLTGTDFQFIPVNSNTGATTININGLGTKAITKYGSTALVAGDLVLGTVAQITYDGIQFQLINPLTPNVLETGRLLNTQVFSTSGTYTPIAGCTSVIIEALGAGGGGGGAFATVAGQVSVGGGGGSGAYTRGKFAVPGVTAFTIGAAGAGGAIGGAGGTGGTTSFGAILTALGGAGGGTAGASTNSIGAGGAGGGVGIGGNIVPSNGKPGETVIGSFASFFAAGGMGGSSVYSGGSLGGIVLAANTATAGAGLGAGAFGSGGGGAAAQGTSAGAVGGSGQIGLLIIHEYS